MTGTASPWAPHDRLRQQAIDTALAFLQAQATRSYAVERRRQNDATVMRLRDSLIYRSDALTWHRVVITRLQKSAIARLHAAFPQPNAPNDILRDAAREQQFTFDDVIFNAITLFDYVGNMIGFAYYGDQRRKAKWDRIQKYARDAVFDSRHHKNPRIAGSEVGSLLTAAESSLVQPLADYRADLIPSSRLLWASISSVIFCSIVGQRATSSGVARRISATIDQFSQCLSGSVTASLRDVARSIASRTSRSRDGAARRSSKPNVEPSIAHRLSGCGVSDVHLEHAPHL